MAELTLRVHRAWTERFEDVDQRRALHLDRSKRVHGLVDTLGLEVKDWGETDAAYPREIVEIIVALGGAGVFTAMVSVFKAWLERDKMRDVELVLPDGTCLRVRSAKATDIQRVAQALGLNDTHSDSV
jgi:hypothetical protein